MTQEVVGHDRAPRRVFQMHWNTLESGKNKELEAAVGSKEENSPTSKASV